MRAFFTPLAGAIGILVLALASAQAAQKKPAAAARKPVAAAQKQAATVDKNIPNFSGLWERAGKDPSTWEVPEGLISGPLTNTIDSPILWAADEKNPILKPWVAEVVKKNGDSERAGVSVPVAHNLCWPEGTPSVLNLRENVQLLQTPKEVTILFQRDHQVRHVYLNVPHSKDPGESWNGESVGHYEGDTLVVDTIGLNGKSAIDRYGTPTTNQLHSVERYQLVDNGKTLRATVMIDDPGAFTMPWYAQASYKRGRPGSWEEVACAENNFDVVAKKEYPIPRAAKADF